jgi:hypothetical protein
MCKWKTWGGNAAPHFKAFFSRKEIKKTHERLQSEYSVFRPGLKLATFQTQPSRLNDRAALFRTQHQIWNEKARKHPLRNQNTALMQFII